MDTARVDAGGLQLPADEPRMREVFSHLTEEGKATFLNGFLEALFQSRALSDLRPLQNFVNAWYRTLLFVERPTFREAVVWADNLKVTRKTGHDAKDARALLDLPESSER